MNKENDTNVEVELDESCELIYSDLCFWLSHKVGCRGCYVHTLKSTEQKQDALSRWKQTLALLPRDIDKLHETDECQFCKGENQKADGYANFEMANPEPYFEKGMFFGIGKKVRTQVGSMISVQAAICPKCKNAFRMGDIIQIVSLIVFVVLGVVLLTIPPIGVPIANLFVLLPVVFVVLMGVAGYFVGKNGSIAYLKKKSETVKIDLAEIPDVKKMLARDWFFFQMVNGIPRISFSKKKQHMRLFKKQEEIRDIDDDIPLDNINI